MWEAHPVGNHSHFRDKRFQQSSSEYSRSSSRITLFGIMSSKKVYTVESYFDLTEGDMASTGTAEIQGQRASKHSHAKAHCGISSYMSQTLSDNQELLVLANEIKALLTTINHTTQAVTQLTTGVSSNSESLQQLLTLFANLRANLSYQTAQLQSLGVKIVGGQVIESNKMSEIVKSFLLPPMFFNKALIQVSFYESYLILTTYQRWTSFPR